MTYVILKDSLNVTVRERIEFSLQDDTSKSFGFMANFVLLGQHNKLVNKPLNSKALNKHKIIQKKIYCFFSRA
jgi:hypothetical protein